MLAVDTYWLRYGMADQPFLMNLARHIRDLDHQVLEKVYSECPFSKLIGGCNVTETGAARVELG